MVRLIFASLTAMMISIPVALAGDAPPEGEDALTWCEANEDACATWCESNPEAEICKEPECD